MSSPADSSSATRDGAPSAAGAAAAPDTPPHLVLDGRPDLALALWMLVLTGIWGVNAVSIKVLTAGVSPVMGATLRNGGALLLLGVYGLARGYSFRCPRAVLGHVAFSSVFFAAEFVMSYTGARLSNAGHFAIFLNTSPFVVAVGAHFLFPQDRFSVGKLLGLLGAFSGVVLLFSDSLRVHPAEVWRGDALILGSAVMWGASTLYVKRFILGHITPFQLLFTRLLIATPLMLAFSRLVEPDPLAGFSSTSLLMLLYQSGAVVFFSYMMFIVLLTRYPPSSVQSFAFMTPVWGVLAGVVLLREPLSPAVLGSMALIGAGLWLVNRPRSPAAPAGAGPGAPPPAAPRTAS